MVLAIIILCVASLLYVFIGITVGKGRGKRPVWSVFIRRVIKAISIIFMVVSICRLIVPYYLVSVDPYIVKEMVISMQQEETMAKNRAIRNYVRHNMKTLTADAPVLGNPNAKKTIFIWTDFTCPYCRRVHGELTRLLSERNDVRVVIKNFAVHGPLSGSAARASIAAKLQDAAKTEKFINTLMTSELYSNQDVKDLHGADKAKAEAAEKRIENNVLKIAGDVGLDVEQLKKDMDSDVVTRELKNVYETAQHFEVSGTPFLIINEQAFPGAIPYAQIVKALR